MVFHVKRICSYYYNNINTQDTQHKNKGSKLKLKDELKELYKKLKKFIRKLLGKEKKVEEPAPVPEPQPEPTPEPKPEPPKPEPEPPKDPYGGKPPGEYVGWSDPVNHPMNNWEPLKTEKADRVDSFLWKPVSDNTHMPVVVVSCDKVRRMDLYIELYDSQWQRINYGVNTHNGDGRGNRIHKYARINFYIKVPAENLKAHGPFNVKFYQLINGQKHYLEIINTGLDYAVVHDATVRVDKR